MVVAAAELDAPKVKLGRGADALAHLRLLPRSRDAHSFRHPVSSTLSMARSDSTQVETSRPDVTPAAGPDTPGLLVVASPLGSLIGSFHALAAAETVVGRGIDATVRVEDPGISRAHVKVVRRPGGGMAVVDLGSTNGTYVNGVRVRTVALSEGDRIQIGTGTTFRCTARRSADDGEVRLRQALAASGAGPWEWDAASGRLSFSGGIARAASREQDATDPQPEDAWPAIPIEDQASVRQRLGETLSHGGPCDIECRLLRPDGSTGWVAMRGEVFRDESGAPVRLAGMAMDVSERKRAELELRRQSLLFESLSEGVAVVGLDGSILDWNSSAERLFGWSKADALGRRPGALLEPDGRDGLTARVLACAAGERRAAEERTLRRKDGVELAVEIAALPLRDGEGRIVACVAIYRDVDERKRLQARLQVAERLAALGTLAAGVAHEINNPLSFVSANLSWLQGQIAKAGAALGAARADVEAAFSDVQQGAERIRSIVRDLQAFSAGSNGDQAMPTDVNEALEFPLRVADGAIRHRARLVKDLGRVPKVAAGASRLGQVFLNLLVNAAHAIPPGRAAENELRLTTRHDQASGRVVVEVADTGVGIRAEDLARIFDPFYTTKPPGVGSGLGLFVCQGIVTALGGEITVESQPGAGSTFRVWLPALDEAAGRRSARVLVVDDEPLLGSAIQRWLGDRHQVTVETDPRRALQRFQSARFDLVLCDLSMPEMSGMELHARLQEADPQQAARVVFITGGPADEETRQFLDRSSAPRLKKPLDLARLEKLVEEALERGRDGPG
jgi:PAS domain S-box-containing protein